MGPLPPFDLLCGLGEATSPSDTSASLLEKHFNFCPVEKSKEENVHFRTQRILTNSVIPSPRKEGEAICSGVV